jgi:outer membrane protein TolC
MPVDQQANPSAPIARAAGGDPPIQEETLPIMPNPTSKPPAELSHPATTATVLPLGLDTVLRLAEEQNSQIALARERVREAYAEQDVAAARWLPDVYAGTAFYRHEGGIQNEDGTLTHSSTSALFAGMEIDSKLDIKELAYQKVNAQRKLWQQKGDLSRVTSETLLDAASTYIDLLTARTGESIGAGLEKNLRNLLDRAKALASVEPSARLEVSRIQAELDAQRQTNVRLHSQTVAAAAKLIYLLGLDPSTQILPTDRRLVPIDLVDASPPTSDLVAQALAKGPGVQEMEGLLALIQDSVERSQGAGKYLPIFEVRMAEGAYGAGPGDQMSWDNRWDLGLQARWNLTEFLTQKDRRRVAQARIQQAHLAYQDLRGKLTAGVQEGRASILSGREQIHLGEAQVSDASQAMDLSEKRLKENPQPTSYSESLLAHGAVARAQLNYLSALSAYNKAQIRLMVLLGPEACRPK